jgi:hypothetical protein
MNFQTINASASPETQVNENFETIDYTSVYGKRHPVTTALTWGYYGGMWGGFTITAATLTLSNSTNYLVVARATGVFSTSTSSTNWDNPLDYARVYKIVCSGSVVTSVEDHRAGPGGVFQPTESTTTLVKAIGSPDANITLTATEAVAQVIEITGNPASERDIIVPVATGRQWTFFCNTTGAGIRVVGSGSPTTGISIAVGKHAIVRANGSTVLRVTADNP